MASIQQSFNQALMSIQHAAGMRKYIKYQKETAETLKSIQEENRMIAAAEAEQEARDKEAQKAGFTDAQQQHEVQLAAGRAAEDLEKKGVKIGFYTHEEPTGTAFGDPNPSDRYKLPGAIPKSSPIEKIEPTALQSFIERSNSIENQKKGLDERKKILGGANDGKQE